VTLPETIPFLGFGWNDLLFMVLGAVMVIAALVVVLQKDIIRSGLAMIICFAALAGIYVIAGTPVVAAAQVLVYIGAISVLVLFAIMLTQTKAAPRALVFQTQVVPAAIASIILAVLIGLTVVATDWPQQVATQIALAKDIAFVLFQQYTLPFEVVSVLLLAAVVGGVFLAKRERGEAD
jgi:NADH:ubiquinone oxidoreductase subunit 6 (subunit J)